MLYMIFILYGGKNATKINKNAPKIQDKELLFLLFIKYHTSAVFFFSEYQHNCKYDINFIQQKLVISDLYFRHITVLYCLFLLYFTNNNCKQSKNRAVALLL